jgi:hypothetical protein
MPGDPAVRCARRPATAVCDHRGQGAWHFSLAALARSPRSGLTPPTSGAQPGRSAATGELLIRGGSVQVSAVVLAQVRCVVGEGVRGVAQRVGGQFAPAHNRLGGGLPDRSRICHNLRTDTYGWRIFAYSPAPSRKSTTARPEKTGTTRVPTTVSSHLTAESHPRGIYSRRSARRPRRTRRHCARSHPVIRLRAATTVAWGRPCSGGTAV